MEFKADGSVIYAPSSSDPGTPPETPKPDPTPEPDPPAEPDPAAGIQPAPEMEPAKKKRGWGRKKASD
tara:strand:- start:1392 stop:1595 length:204 start_codon:yes stop_codon:yes gene_type:complete